jgi:hypothetical protein
MYKTIPRSHTKQIATIQEAIRSCLVFSKANYFRGEPGDLEWVWDQYLNHDHGRLIDRGDGGYRIDVHANLWYDLT